MGAAPNRFPQSFSHIYARVVVSVVKPRWQSS
jgi:hypothetical protein